jgi:hypothetical protein
MTKPAVPSAPTSSPATIPDMIPSAHRSDSDLP